MSQNRKPLEDCKNEIEEFSGYIKLIGKGQRSGVTLSQDQAKRAMQLLLDRKIAPEQEGAFLMLLRVREETKDEIAGFTQACRDTIAPQFNDLHVDLDVSAYAGKRRQLPWFLLAIATLAQTGVRVLLHGTQEPHSNRLYAKQVLTHFGIAPCESASAVAKRLDDSHFAFADLKTLHPKLDRLIQLREIFGLRSCANTLARLLNPAKAPYSFQGVHHRHVDVKHMEVSALLRDPHTMCIRGEGGEPEHNPAADTQLCINRNGVQEVVDIPAVSTWQMKDTKLELDMMQKLFDGSQTHSYGEATVVNTLRDILLLMQQLKPQDAHQAAVTLWQGRNKTTLFTEYS